jgi:ribbon-helix-helix CopG family protein
VSSNMMGFRLDDDECKALSDSAKEQGKSIGDLLRDLVREHLQQRYKQKLLRGMLGVERYVRDHPYSQAANDAAFWDALEEKNQIDKSRASPILLDISLNLTRG